MIKIINVGFDKVAIARIKPDEKGMILIYEVYPYRRGRVVSVGMSPYDGQPATSLCTTGDIVLYDYSEKTINIEVNGEKVEIVPFSSIIGVIIEDES